MAINFICLIGVSISNLVFLKGVIVELLLSVAPNIPPLLQNTSFWAIFLLEVIILPLSLFRRMKGVSYISNISSLLPALFLILTIIHFSLNGPDDFKSSNLMLMSPNPNNFLEVYSLFQFTFMVQPNIQ